MARTVPIVAAALSGLLVLVVVACQPVPEQPPSARQDFSDNCAACHGAGGTGDGPATAGLARKPADLTGISARNGGDFPMAQVMSTINGYFRPDSSEMPHFGDVLDSATVLVDTGDGIATPAPERLVALANYLRSIQR